MAASATLVSMAHERKVENLRAFMVNLANSRAFCFLRLNSSKRSSWICVYHLLLIIPLIPLYMIFVAIMDLNEEGGSSEEAICEFIKSKYKNLPFAHTSLLSHHLAKLVEKKEILYDCNNYCYSLPGDKKTVASTDSETKSAVITVRSNDQRAANEVMSFENEEESVRGLRSRDHKVDLLEEQSLTESGTSPRGKACCSINVIEVKHTEDNGVKAGLRDSSVETLGKEGVAQEPEVTLGNSETESRIGANNEEGELYEVVVLYEQNEVLMEKSGKEVMETSSKQRKEKLCRTSNTMKEACVEVKSEAYKRLWECQTEACSNIIALKKMLKQCREKDQQNKTVSEFDDVSHLPLSLESCKELWKVAQHIQSQLSEIIDSCDEAVAPYSESRGCVIEGISNGFVKEDPKMITPCGSEKTSKQLEQKEREIDSQKKPQVKKTRMKRLRDIGTTAVRKSPRFRL